MDGRKTVEGRLDTGPASRIHVGSLVLFRSGTNVVVAHVTRVRRFATFHAMLDECGLFACLPTCRTLADGLAIYHGFPGYRKGITMYGAVAFDLRVEKGICGSPALGHAGVSVGRDDEALRMGVGATRSWDSHRLLAKVRMSDLRWWHMQRQIPLVRALLQAIQTWEPRASSTPPSLHLMVQLPFETFFSRISTCRCGRS